MRAWKCPLDKYKAIACLIACYSLYPYSRLSLTSIRKHFSQSFSHLSINQTRNFSHEQP